MTIDDKFWKGHRYREVTQHIFQDLYGIFSENGKKLDLQNITVNHAGRYTCTADNGVGNPVSEDITLKVLCKYFEN